MNNVVAGGSLFAAVPLAVLAGLVSFLSPCVLPLVPGYLSYVTGMSGADLEAHRRGRMVAGALLFVLGFSVVFVSAGLAFGGLGGVLHRYADLINRFAGVLTILLGLLFLGAFRAFPGLQRTLQPSRVPAAGLAGAPMLGVVFGLGWTPCIGPTLAAVQLLAFTEASAVRGAALSCAYALGLGAPFVLVAVAYRRALGAFGVVKRNYRLVTRIGGGMLVALGLLLMTGLWADMAARMQGLIGGFRTVI